MKIASFILIFLLPAASIVCQTPEDSKSANKLNNKNKLSYSIGYDIGSRYKKILKNADVATLLKGLRDAINGAEPTSVTKEELPKKVQAFLLDYRMKEEEARKSLGAKNKIAGAAFLEKNALKEGIKTTKSGLQYQILTEGTGAKPGPADTVTIHYKGCLIDGTEFHDSYKSAKPVSFPITKTFPGWAEALRMMKVGAKWKIFLPPELAFGENGFGDKVGAHAVIIFDMELLETKPAVKEEKTNGKSEK
jgi:FKBP-type peptidyl-prolyl cis-trans isomerase